MIKHLTVCGLACVSILFTSCNDDSGFSEGRGQQPVVLEEPAPVAESGDATPAPASDDALPATDIGQIENKNIVEQETCVAARNPFAAEESSIYSFVAVQELNDDFTITLDNKDVMVDFKLENIESERTVNLEQRTRTPMTETFTQGTPGQTLNETFDQADKRGIVDILVVVDDSGSMAEEQKNLSDKLDDLLTYLDQTNWQIGVITTDYKSDCRLTLTDHTDPMATEKFRQAVQAGTKGSGNEQGIRQAVNGLSCSNMPWVRNDSTVAVLIVSDEDNCSKNGSGCGSEAWNNESFLIDYVENSLGREVGKNAGFYGIFSHPDMPCNTAYNTGFQYARLVAYKANGQQRWGDICDADYGNTLRKISENIASLILNQWELQNQPDAGTTVKVEIEVNGVRTMADPNSYTLVGKTLTFNAGMEPPIGSKIHVTYTVGSKPLFDKVTLGSDPAPETVMVAINGAMLNAGQFNLQGRDIQFAQRPAANAKVMIDYRLNQPLIVDFNIGNTASPKDGKLAITIDGNATQGFAYNAATRNVRFDATPSDGQKIQIKFTNIDGPKLSYKLPLSGNNPRNFRLLYNDAAIDFDRNADVFTIEAADHELDRTLRLKYEVDDGATKMFQLPNLPIADSLSIASDTMDCALNDGFVLNGSTLVSDCVVVDITQFVLSYRYLATQSSFEISAIEAPEKYNFEVRIDGVKTDNFSLDGRTIVLASDPEIGAVVDVYVTSKDQ